ncbi:MAG: hypothetical protein LBG62_05160 [Candidatus Methanoplasma sp.]|jgi:hypothetical protein|nr:hypothetical protein [Candidatus Methanoplasma sp.]
MADLNIGQWIYGALGDSTEGVLLCVFLIFLIDAIAFPTLPEVFFAAGIMFNPDPAFAAELLLAAIAAELAGTWLLYAAVGRTGVPARIEKLASKYAKFLIMGDERLLLLNRAAPMIPFAGAFIRIMKWRIGLSMAYIASGCVLKYGAIAALSGFFYGYFESGAATNVTVAFIIAVVAASTASSLIMSRRRAAAEGREE